MRVAVIPSLDGLHCLVHGGLEHVVLQSSDSGRGFLVAGSRDFTAGI